MIIFQRREEGMPGYLIPFVWDDNSNTQKVTTKFLSQIPQPFEVAV